MYIVGLLFWAVQGAWGQSYPRDTSYTVQGTYAKYKKKFPEIEVAQAIPSAELRQYKGVVYATHTGRDLCLNVYEGSRPAEHQPMIVMVHGGGWISGAPDHLEPLAQTLAMAGYVTATVEYRLSPEAIYPAGVRDVKYAVRWLKTRASDYGVDTSRMVLLGSSAGGQIAALVGLSGGFALYDMEDSTLHASSRVQGVIDMDGVLAFHHPDSQEGQVAGLWLGGAYESVPETWEEASPLSHVSADDPPILFVNSSSRRFRAGREDVIERYDAYGIYHQSYTFGTTPHTFWLFDPWFAPTVAEILSFMEALFPSE
ncbi:hypothetical protein BFP72_04305 [Reichenbachiella sp. 5M10]|uniref:alpha/beta hydrolase n=1 Tax=Reichenbachiella sp. 5M10 TaxID=1889772 RepID=UPI000C1571F8|nr:alpha/beta hydrolase [Reichenbachiella sp. 5M10]PIB34686.1 hypothetical protein BFP72_04305 [Reichenbachiella sp. 5M10]